MYFHQKNSIPGRSLCSGEGAQCEEKREKKYFLVIQFDVQLGHRPTLCSSTQNNKRQPLCLQVPLGVLFLYMSQSLYPHSI